MKNIGFLKIIIVGLVLGFGVKFFAVEAFTVPTESMQPTILRGDVVWLNKLKFRRFGKGDIVGFERFGENFIKRIVGDSSDIVVMFNGKYELLNKNKIFQNTKITNFYKIPKKNETLKIDTENFNFYQPLIEHCEGVSTNNVMGKIFINNSESNNYTFKQNYYFVQGDNTEGSIDSRDWGLIAENQIIGKPIFTRKY